MPSRIEPEIAPAPMLLDRRQKRQFLLVAIVLGLLVAGQLGLVIWLFFQPAGY